MKLNFFILLLICVLSCSCEDKYGTVTPGSNNGSGTGSGTGTGTGTGSNTIKTGTFKIRIYKPTGTCASSSTWGRGWAFIGTMGGQRYDANGNPNGTYYPVNTGGAGLSNNDSPASYWDYTITNINKITWDLWPNKSSFPSGCSRKGEATIEFAGQTKEVVINW